MSQKQKDEVKRLVFVRNFEAVSLVLGEMDNKILEQNKLIASLQTALSAMTERLSSLETMLLIQKAKSIGSGPTVRL